MEVGNADASVKRLFEPTNIDSLNYLKETRGFTEGVITKFEIGLDREGNYTIPVKSVGKLIGTKLRRSHKNGSGPKYKNPKGLSSSVFNRDVILGMSREKKRLLILCEGEFDVITLTQLGFNAICQTTGAGFDTTKIEQLLERRPNLRILVGFDNDPKGISEMVKIAEYFLANQKVKYLLPQDNKKDWNDWMTNLLASNDLETVKKSLKEQIRHSTLSAYSFLKTHSKDSLKNQLILATSALANFEDEKLEYIVDPYVVQNGINLVTGAPGSLKSMLVLDMCIRAQNRQKLFEEFHTKRIKKVLLLDQENLKSQLKERIAKLGGNINNFFLPDDPIYFDKTEEITEKIINLIRLEGIDVVVIDTLRRTNIKLDENDSRSVNQLFSKLIKIKEYATVVLIHHENKAKDNNGNSSYRGSGDIQGAVDSHISVKKESQPTCDYLTISQRKARYSSQQEDLFVVFRYSEESFEFGYQGTKKEVDAKKIESTRNEQKNALMEVLKTSKNGMSTREIEVFCKERFGIGQHKARELRNELLNDGLVAKQDNYQGTKSTYYFPAQQLDTYID